MARYSYPQLYHPDAERYGLPEHEYSLIAAFYDHASKAIDFFADIGALESASGGMMPDYLEYVPENKAPRGRTLYPKQADGSPGGGVELIRQMREWATRHDVVILTNLRARRLVMNKAGEILGLEATDRTGETVSFRARKGVIFGTGGFTHNRELVLNFHRGPIYGGCAVPTCEGDFVYIAGAVGAKLGNMSSAFHGEVVLEQALQFSSTPSLIWQCPGDSMILVNRYGRRVTNEKRNYNDRTQIHFVYDPVRAEWPNRLLFMVYDSRCADVYAGTFPLPTPNTTAPYVIQGQTLKELADAIRDRLDQLATQIGGFQLDENFAANLEETVQRFNRFAERGVDEDFGRGSYEYDREWYPQFSTPNPSSSWPEAEKANITMYPFQSTGPYYAIILGAGTLDTNGGPMTNADAQILNTEHVPIPGLYGAGNCIAAPSANAYWGGGGTLGPALTFGYLAGKHAAHSAVKEVRGEAV